MAGLALFDIHLADYPTHFRTIMYHFLIATRLTIASNWKASYIPPIKEVIDHVNFTFRNETTLVENVENLDTWLLWNNSGYFE